MNPNPGIGLKAAKQGYAMSAKTANATSKAVFGARGTNGNNVRWEGNILVVEGPGFIDTTHPFKISAAFDNAAAPTICLVSIQSGSLQSSPYASGSTYAGIPLFEGSGGSLLNAATPPTYDVGVTARTNYFYLVITTNVYGLVNTVWIDHLLAAAVPPVDVPYVQPGFPLASDTGTAGTYYIRIGTVTVAGADPNKTITIGDPQEVENNLGFRVCGGAGVHYTS